MTLAEDDLTFPHASRRRAEDIMVSRKCTYYFQVFSGVKHGFAVRGNPDVADERKQPIHRSQIPQGTEYFMQAGQRKRARGV